MRSILVALPLLLATPALAQQTDRQLWLQTNASLPVGEREKVTLEGIGLRPVFPPASIASFRAPPAAAASDLKHYIQRPESKSNSCTITVRYTNKNPSDVRVYE